jgi:hypothetical protein
MKIRGQSFDKPKPVSVVLTHGDDNILILCGTVVDYDLFHDMVPAPVAPKILKPGGVTEINIKDSTFLDKVHEHSKIRTYWLVKESLRATPDLEWETVIDDKPESWPNLEKEMVQAFGEVGMAQVIQGVLRANGLSDALMGEARDSFLASQLLLQKG